MKTWLQEAKDTLYHLKELESKDIPLDYHIAKKMMIAHWVVENHKGGSKEFIETVKYCHHKNHNDLDIEMERIVNTGTKEHMESLSMVLSEHYGNIKENHPMMYNQVLSKFKDIR
ncbi:MAG: hypothetical protein R3Y60_01960 [bacterium]